MAWLHLPFAHCRTLTATTVDHHRRARYHRRLTAQGSVHTLYTITDITTIIDSAGAGKLSCVLSIVLNSVLNTTEKSNTPDMYTESYMYMYDDH